MVSRSGRRCSYPSLLPSVATLAERTWKSACPYLVNLAGRAWRRPATGRRADPVGVAVVAVDEG